MTVPSINRNNAVYVGIDVHRYTHTAVAADRFEEKMGELTFPNTTKGINKFLSWSKNLAPEEKPRIIGIEGANGNGRLLRDLVMPYYQELYEVNPIYTKQRRDHGTSGNKSDPVDAGLIIEILTRKLDELPKVTKQDSSVNLLALEQLVTFHDDLVRSQTRLKNQLHRLFHEINPEYISARSKTFSHKSLRQWRVKTIGVKAKSIDEEVRLMIVSQKMQQFEKLQKIQGETDMQMDLLLSKLNANLTTLPGIGIITAAKIIAAVRGIERFTLDGFVKYAGIAPIEKQSGKTKKHKQAKGGNRQLNNALYTVALTELRFLPKAKAYFEKKIKEGKTKKHALRCLMKRVACIVYGMLRSGEKYRG